MSDPGFIVVIPARYASSRFPGKPLVDIHGKTMIERVYDQAVKSQCKRIIIATDDERISRVAKDFSAEVCMTSAYHQSGSDRLADVVEQLHIDADEVVVNVQGDEPFIPPVIIRQVANLLNDRKNSVMATLCKPLTRHEDLFDPNKVKVVFNQKGQATYFSRAPIPWVQSGFVVHQSDNKLEIDYRLDEIEIKHYCHIGIYAYRASFLQEYVKWPRSSLEEIEHLEQLRVLEHGHPIEIEIAEQVPPTGIDTKADLAYVIDAYKEI